MGSPCSPGIALPSRAIDPRIPLRAEAICCGKLQRAESCCCRCCFCCCFCGLLLKVSAWSELTKLVQICPSDGSPILDSEIIARGRSQLAPSCRFFCRGFFRPPGLPSLTFSPLFFDGPGDVSSPGLSCELLSCRHVLSSCYFGAALDF